MIVEILTKKELITGNGGRDTGRQFKFCTVRIVNKLKMHLVLEKGKGGIVSVDTGITRTFRLYQPIIKLERSMKKHRI